jgi:hypothetical protein
MRLIEGIEKRRALLALALSLLLLKSIQFAMDSQALFLAIPVHLF